MTAKPDRPTFAVCVANDGCDDLAVWKLYRLQPDADAEGEGYIRVIDESGEDYLYPAGRFVQVQFPPTVSRKILAATAPAGS